VRRITLWVLATIATLVLLFSYRTSTMGIPRPAPVTAATGPSYNGKMVPTKYGPIQVRITVIAGTITDVAAIVTPAGSPRTERINADALPQLRAHALSAQSADIDTVSGATYTSAAYRESLQAAITNAKS
jgi:uncharacterized protein with FMN-binding domain